MHISNIIPTSTLLVIATAIIIITLLAKFKKLTTSEKPATYVTQPAIFSAAERSFLATLSTAENDNVTLYAKIRLADIFSITPGTSRTSWQIAKNKIAQKHIDFLFVDKRTGKPIAGIELDDNSHNHPSRKARDEFVNSVFQSASLPIVHFKTKFSYARTDLIEKLNNAIGSKSFE